MTNTIDLEILSCGAGDLEVKFDGEKPDEVAKARVMIMDMLRRGYALFVHGEGDEMIRVRRFSPKHDCYIIGDKKEPKRLPIRGRPLPSALAMMTAISWPRFVSIPSAFTVAPLPAACVRPTM